MQNLRTITRDGQFTLWDEYFKEILFILCETISDSDADVRTAALNTLKEIW